ncbi:Ig-like domain-containing protein [Methanobacterium spitsbergense]|uniref:Ig-like domain-containing protein n=1 Tax=Methanobacterium spitsbergense TaxID=2874285 RepID=A0A8T5UST8_9EURY|nr:Ig-like domain-containing protein [Methanobacterium spitsbergense]MBZ2167112.1 Ig-like domain-containing protein [Methanobacterium spitsbergense]
MVLVVLITLLAVIFALGMGNVSAAPGDTIYVNGNSTLGNDDWNGESATYQSGIIGPKYSIKNATGTVNTNGQIYIAHEQYKGINNTQITINKNMTINGESQTDTIINGTGTNWIFKINSGIYVTINNLTLTNGNTTYGGAIYNNYGGTLTVNNSTFTSNSAQYYGGAIYNNGGTLIITDSNLTSNTAEYGGAIYNGGTLTVTDCNLTSNTANYGNGGAIYNGGGTVTVNNSTFTSNSANSGGGAILNYGTVTVNNSTFTSNTADVGGAILNYSGTLTVNNSTFTSNTAQYYGGAIYNSYVGTVNVSFCRIVGNTPQDIYSDGSSCDVDYNWWGSNFVGSDPVTAGRVVGATVSKWLVLTTTSDPDTINTGETSNITADLLHDQNGVYQDPAGGHVPDGIVVNFASDALGTVNPLIANTLNGKATTTFTGNSPGISTVSATVDAQTVNTDVTINTPTADIDVTKNFYYEDLGPIIFPDNPLDRYWKFFSEVIVTNNGPDTATNVKITDLLGTGMELAPFDIFGSWFVTYTGQNPDLDPPENNPSFDPLTMIWTIPTMNNGDVWVLDFFTIANTTGTVNNTATFDPATADQYDPNTTNNVGFAETYVPTAQTQLTKWYQNNSTYGSPHTTTAYYLDNLYAFIKLYNNGPDTAKYITIIDDFTGNLIYNSALMETSYDGGLTWGTDPNAYWLDFGTYSELEWFPNDIALNGMALFRIPAQVNVSNTTITNNATETQRTFNPDGDNTDNPPINQPGFNTINTTTTLNVPLTPTTITVNPATGFKGDIVDLIATLTDTYNNIPLAGQTIQFNVDGNPVGTATTNALGIATLQYTITQTQGIYTILAEFLQDNTYAASSNTNTLDVLDNTPPVVTSSNPVNNSFNVALNKVIQITFNEAIKFGANPWIELKFSSGTGAAIPFTSSIVGNILSITPNSLLDAGRKYTVILHSNSITDLAGNGLTAPYTTRFTTSAPPVVTSTSPVNNAVNVAVNKVVQINFSKAIQLGTNPWIELKNQYGQIKPYTTSINGSTLNITANAAFARGTTYTVILHSNSVTSTGGAGLTTPYTTKFTTTTT